MNCLCEYLNTIKGLTYTTAEEEKQIGETIRAAKTEESVSKARRLLIQRHLPLVVRLAWNYRDRGIEMMDLIQDGNVALVKAANKWEYDERQDSPFAAFAIVYINNALKNSIRRSHIIYLPHNTFIAISKICKVAAKIHATTGRRAMPEQIAKEMIAPLHTVKELHELWRTAWSIIPLDAPLQHDTEASYMYFLADRSECSDPAHIVFTDELQKTVDDVLKTLEPVEERVIRYRFGFVNGHSYTQAEVCTACGLTLAEARTTEARAMRRLRHPSRSSQLIGLLG